MAKCPFCNLDEKDKKWLLYENEYWTLFLADKQDYLGRCIIVCNQHCESISDLDIKQWNALKSIMDSAEIMLRSELNATMFNWSCLMNDAYKNKPANPHIHFHLRPRYENEVLYGNNLISDREFAHHYDNHAPAQIDEETANRVYIQLKSKAKIYFGVE